MTEAPANLLGLLIAATALGFLAFTVVTITSFVKVSVVMFLLRNALGVQQAPPNIVLYGIALILTAFISAPFAHRLYATLNEPGVEYRTVQDWADVAHRAEQPLHDHLIRFTSDNERAFFLSAAARLWPEDMRGDLNKDSVSILVPAFLIGELKRAFEIGLLLYLPFVVVDLTITTILMAMGMSQVQPTTLAVPLKLFLFVIIEGWTRLLHGLVLSYVT